MANINQDFLRKMSRDYFAEAQQERLKVPCTNSLEARLPYAHYTDERFNKEQLVFDSGDTPEKSDEGAYDDRLRSWDWDAYDRGIDAAREAGHQPSTAAFFQAVLSSYHKAPVKLKKVYTGCNLSSGYQYWAFCYSVQPQAINQP